MSYKFNNGRGAVICDQCKRLIDHNLSFAEYEKVYGKDGHDNFCWKCKTGFKEKSTIQKK